MNTGGGPLMAQMPSPREPAAELSAARFWSWVVVACTVVVALSAAATLHFRHNADSSQAPPVFSEPSGDLEGTERNGEPVRLSSLRGKVVAIAHVYTVCPHGCAAVLGEMMKLKRRFAAHPDFHLVSVAVTPEHDTPSFLRSFAEGMGLTTSDPWWFVTGDRQKLWYFMSADLKLQAPKPIPEEERLNPLDLYEHDLRVVLLDRSGRVRGYYSVFHPQKEIGDLMSGRLERDARFLLGHPDS